MHSRLSRTIDERLKIINEVENNPNEKLASVAKRLGLPSSTLATILMNKESIRANAHKFASTYKTRKTGRNSNFVALEEELIMWFEQMNAKSIPVDGKMLMEEATNIARRQGILNFAASNGWFCRFKDRQGLSIKRLPSGRSEYLLTGHEITSGGMGSA